MHQPTNHARSVVVLGAGTMGSGITAHLANLGFDVTLFDLTETSVEAGFERAKRMKPPHFYGPETVGRVRLASLDGPLDAIREADWVCEAIIEKLDAKRELYQMIEPLLRPDAMVSTNTSGLEITLLSEGFSDSFRRRFMGTHFFNPPRYLKLIELIPTASTDSKELAKMTAFLEDYVGKRVVLAKDTPGFIANRYGMWVLMQALHTAEKLGFTCEAVDAITGPFIGRPRTGTHRLADLIGFDIMEDICGNLTRRCEADPYLDTLSMPASVKHLMTVGWIGNKAGQGYYKKEGDQFLTYDRGLRKYRPRVEPEIASLASRAPLGERVRTALEARDEVGEFLREHLPKALHYATHVGQEISYSVRDFDDVMKWGWGWTMGPFEMIDAIGYDALAPFIPSKPLYENTPFYGEGKALDLERTEHVPLRQDARFVTVSDFEIAKSGDGWALRDDGMGGHLFELRNKMGALDPLVVRALLDHLEQNSDARITLVSNGPAYSVGYDLQYILSKAESGEFEEMRTGLVELQKAGLALQKARSAAVVQGYGLGGGFELAMRCRTVVAFAEATVGLPEVWVGLVPAGGGTAEMRKRTNGDAKQLCVGAMTIAAGKKVMAAQARKSELLRGTDIVAVNPDSLLFRALHADRSERPQVSWTPAPPMLAGMIDNEIEKLRSTNELGEYGAVVAGEAKHIFVKSTSEAHALELEIDAFLRLMGKQRTHLRIRSMFEHGKPVNN
ncbi:MAG: 3-hydroxyacyl-CoA dehydrogenase/enoyl-CoA hydratase family protein [Armatimonadota bacterium]|nr:3-hydroxyacyl-CoA dehydrogenase/enoyl-CoA hydratase family protein [Armatimonadota bacterium]